MSKAKSKQKLSRKKTKSPVKKPTSLPSDTLLEQIKRLQDELETVQAKLEEKDDLYVRTLAELDNTRKRAARDLEQAHKFALDRFATELLGVRDSLELGLNATKAPGEGADALRQGMEITLKQFTQVMERFGITELLPNGEPFNPEYHEAIAMRPSAEQAPNTVLEVVQKGFMLNGRVLRAARVVVASAPDTAGTA